MNTNALAAAKWVSSTRGIALSVAFTVGIVILILLTSGKASAVGLTINGLASTITQGDSDEFSLELDIPQGELIPIESLRLSISGPDSFSVIFDPLGNVDPLNNDPHITSLGLCPGEPSTGFGYGYGYRIGYENANFVFGYRYERL